LDFPFSILLEMRMHSPFPGMDPYLETYWRDIHTSLMIYSRDAIQDQLPADLFARVEESVSVDTEEGLRSVSPDVRVVEGHTTELEAESAGAAVAVVEPMVVPVDEPLTERHIEIIDVASGGRVVTTMEFLSPSNKIPYAGRDKYVQKQKEYLAGGVNLVEVDLIRNGIFTVAVPLMNIPPRGRGTYYVCIRRAARPTKAFVYGLALREPLPAIRIPLRPTDCDVALHLQQVIDLAYDRGRYGVSIDYTVDPDPPLSPVDARWADELLRNTGRRP
jgi:hypothetical protein